MGFRVIIVSHAVRRDDSYSFGLAEPLYRTFADETNEDVDKVKYKNYFFGPF
jgi:hypothetical protein